MEILASILIVASAVLPLVLVVAIVAFAGLLVYSWFTDLRSEAPREPEAAPQSLQAPAAHRATMPAA